MRVELEAIKKCGANAPGSKFFEPKHIARALVAIGKARYATKQMVEQPVKKSVAPEAPAPEAPAPVATLPPVPKRTLSRKSSKADEA